jgi:phytoene desaturase
MPFGNIWDMVKTLPKMAMLRADRSVHGLVASMFKDERLRIAFSFHPLFIGGNPFSSTAIYCLVSHLEKLYGVHFAMGGTGELVRGMVSLMQGQGSTLRLNAEVGEILVADGTAKGVKLQSGEMIYADIVVSNADMGWTYSKLLAKAPRRRWTDRKIARTHHSMSCFVWYFGTNRRYEDVPHHTILLGPRYKDLLRDIFKRKVLAEDFSLYLHRPTASDPSMAPEGGDAFYVLSPVPHLASGTDWAQMAETYRRKIEAALEERLLPGLKDAVVSSRMMTPQDFQDRLLSTHGAAFGIEPVMTQSAYFRPHNRSEDVKNLFLVGAGTHPGAGVPGVITSAKILEQVIPHVSAFA